MAGRDCTQSVSSAIALMALGSRNPARFADIVSLGKFESASATRFASSASTGNPYKCNQSFIHEHTVDDDNYNVVNVWRKCSNIYLEIDLADQSPASLCGVDEAVTLALVAAHTHERHPSERKEPPENSPQPRQQREFWSVSIKVQMPQRDDTAQSDARTSIRTCSRALASQLCTATRVALRVSWVSI